MSYDEPIDGHPLQPHDSAMSTSEIAHLRAQIDQLRRDRAALINQVEAEEEYITNVLQKRLEQLQKEKVDLESSLEQEQEWIVNRLQKQMEAMRGEGSELDMSELEAVKALAEHQRLKSLEREQECIYSIHDAFVVQRTIASLQTENQHLIQENVCLSQRLRRNSSSFSGGEEHSLSPPRNHLMDHEVQRKSGSISDLRPGRLSFSDSEGGSQRISIITSLICRIFVGFQ